MGRPDIPDSQPLAFDEALGRTIQVLRTDQGLSRRDLAQRAQISYSYLSAIENGAKPPSSKILALLAASLGVHRHELVAAAEARAHQPNSPVFDEDLSDTRLIDTSYERHAMRQTQRYLGGRADYSMAAGPAPPRSDLGRLDELRALLAELDDADAEFLLEMARRLADPDRQNRP
ncbi:MAG: helix-turn-helix domain-containing protein [Acidimicrobiia bacterium]|nr:helix-turn-helix domain-containing protein [Acidimicrobiia bacterium]